MATEHEVWLNDGTTAGPGPVTAIDDDGRCTVVDEEGDGHEQLKREHICHQWQQLLEEMDGIVPSTAQTRLAWRRVATGGEQQRRSSG